MARQEMSEQKMSQKDDTKARDAEYDLMIKRIDQMESNRLMTIPVDQKTDPQGYATQAAEIQREFAMHRQRTLDRFYSQQPSAPAQPGEAPFAQYQAQAESLGIDLVADDADFDALPPGTEYIDAADGQRYVKQ
jgi:hypothetical protein